MADHQARRIAPGPDAGRALAAGKGRRSICRGAGQDGENGVAPHTSRRRRGAAWKGARPAVAHPVGGGAHGPPVAGDGVGHQGQRIAADMVGMEEPIAATGAVAHHFKPAQMQAVDTQMPAAAMYATRCEEIVEDRFEIVHDRSADVGQVVHVPDIPARKRL